ncbi:MAG TPA: hypothetical protein VJ327_04930 [Patescibacteria group bacterium]|nr:hypothetical protein [Patescibacteria group bacterium]
MILQHMATLTEVSYYTRKVIMVTVIAVVLMMITPVLVKIGTTLYRRLNPEPPPPPTVKYGKLPKINFPTQSFETNPTFKLETIQGSLPKMPTQGKVYVVGFNQSRLLELQRVRDRAKGLGFGGEPFTSDELTYTWTNAPVPESLVANIVTGAWKYDFDWRTEPASLVSTDIPASNRAIDLAKAFLGRMAPLPQDLISGSAKVIYMIASASGETRQAQSFSDANFLRVDVFRANMDELPFVTTGGETSPIYVVMNGLKTSNKSERKVVAAGYQYSTLLGESATYPFKSIDQAWSELTQGKGYLTKYLPEITIRKAYLAYFESDEPQSFVQPVFVFAGDGNIIGYVPAVSEELIAK